MNIVALEDLHHCFYNICLKTSPIDVLAVGMDPNCTTLGDSRSAQKMFGAKVVLSESQTVAVCAMSLRFKSYTLVN